MATVAEIEQQLEVARTAEKEAQRLAAERQKQQDREHREQMAHSEREIRAFGEKVERVLAEKVASARPTPKTRGLARKFLHSGIAITTEEYHELEDLCKGDPHFALLNGLNSQAQQMMLNGRSLGEENLTAALDVVECKTWAAVIARARVLAGEA